MAHPQFLIRPSGRPSTSQTGRRRWALLYEGGRKKEDACCATSAQRANTFTDGGENFSGFSSISLFTGTKFEISLHLSSVFGMAKNPAF